VTAARSRRVTGWGVGLLAAALAATLAGAWLIARGGRGSAAGGITVGAAGSAARAWSATPRRHPCVEDALPRDSAFTPPARVDAPVALVALRHDVGDRFYVGDTARRICLGLAVRGALGGWHAYSFDDARGTFTRSAPASRDGTSADEALRAIVRAARP
jgi:hypothetical protein